MPTRDDIARVLGYLQRIESRLLGLEEKIEDLGDRLRTLEAGSQAPRVTRASTRRKAPVEQPD